jgi:hypothetical protein
MRGRWSALGACCSRRQSCSAAKPSLSSAWQAEAERQISSPAVGSIERIDPIEKVVVVHDGFLHRPTADLVQAKGFGSALLKAPRRMRFRVISAKKRSTMLSQDAEVGVKCRRKRGCALSQRFTVAQLKSAIMEYLENHNDAIANRIMDALSIQVEQITQQPRTSVALMSQAGSYSGTLAYLAAVARTGRADDGAAVVSAIRDVGNLVT